MAIYKLAYDREITDELRRRFASDIAIIENDGFKFFGLHQEILHPFSVLVYFPIFVAMRIGNEILKIESPLRISSFHILFASPTHATYAYVYGLGCKFYTNFSDGTWLVSNTQLEVKGDERVIVLKWDPEITSTDFIWKRHQEKVSELLAQGKLLNQRASFNTWVEIDRRFDQSGTWALIRSGLGWLAFVIGVLYCLISILATLAGSG